MARTKKLTERQLTNLVRNVVKEVDSAESASSEVMAPLDQQASYAKLKEFFKDYYQNIKQKLTDVSPSEFNEIEMVLNAVISLAREYNLNNKDPEIIAQQLKRHMRDIQRSDKGATDAAAQKAAGTVEAPDKPEYQEIKEGVKSNYARLYRRLTNRRR
tara:strand:- start:1877 stop:2350 length:474 start_codon:yes stop_codon:yes gene_type:complete